MKTKKRNGGATTASPPEYVVTTLRLTTPQFDTIRAISKATGLTQQHLMRVAVDQFLKNPVLPAWDLKDTMEKLSVKISDVTVDDVTNEQTEAIGKLVESKVQRV